jgi:predicted transcriptional regulator of viral defense system
MSDTIRVVAPRDLPDWLLARGQPWVTNKQIAELLDVTAAEASRVAGRWHAKSLAFSPARGLQMLIPPEYRTWNAVPATHLVDPMMRHLGHPYYVGYLSAAELHGAAHQRPQVFQIVTSARVRNRSFGRVRVEFFTSAATTSQPTVTMNTPTGAMTVATAEITLLDLVAYPRRGGGTSNVATVISSFLEDQKIDPLKLLELSERYPASVVHRAGWLIDRMGAEVGATMNLDALRSRVDRRVEPTPLIASEPRRGPVDKSWNVYINGDVEPDL